MKRHRLEYCLILCKCNNLQYLQYLQYFASFCNIYIYIYNVYFSQSDTAKLKIMSAKKITPSKRVLGSEVLVCRNNLRVAYEHYKDTHIGGAKKNRGICKKKFLTNG